MHECAADTGCARARPRRARLRRHCRTYGALRPQAPWLHCSRTVVSMFTHPNLPTSTSKGCSHHQRPIHLHHQHQLRRPCHGRVPAFCVVLHARAAGQSAALSAWVATIALASTSSSVPTSAHKLFSGPLNSESSRRSDTCVALFGMGEELISLSEHRSLLHLRQEHPHLLLHAQRQRGGSVIFPADPSSSTNSAAT